MYEQVKSANEMAHWLAASNAPIEVREKVNAACEKLRQANDLLHDAARECERGQ